MLVCLYVNEQKLCSTEDVWKEQFDKEVKLVSPRAVIKNKVVKDHITVDYRVWNIVVLIDIN